jgi:hypothetical protein
MEGRVAENAAPANEFCGRGSRTEAYMLDPGEGKEYMKEQ